MKIAVIGAGVSGLTCVKVCREYGFDVVCFEKTHDIGGLWRYKPEECDGEASVMKSTIINTSKEMMAFSDYPPPKELPNYMHNTNVMKYFRSYVDNFNLLPYIRFKIDVKLVKRSPKFDQTGQWDITYTDLTSGETTTETFDSVMVATGHHVDPHCPTFKGLEKFKGRVLHSHSYKDHRSYEDKRVLVVGIGNSGGDIAVELGRVSSQVYIVTRKGNWVINRVFYFGLPLDMVLSSRLVRWFGKVFPFVLNAIFEFHANLRFNHELYGLKAKHRMYQQHPMVNDDLPNRIVAGTVIPKPDIREFTETGVIFEDGTVAEDLDVVILCTGYNVGFPVLEKDLIKVDNNWVTLYKLMYATNLSKPTLALIGCFQPTGALMPVTEMQSRLHCEVLLNRVKLPTEDVMLKMAERYNKANRMRYVASRRHTIQLDVQGYMSDLASTIGAYPKLASYIFNDPQLAYHLVTGPGIPYQYRLEGPHKWSGARDAIVNTWDRALYQLKSSRRPAKDDSKFPLKKIIVFIFSLFFFWLLRVTIFS